MRKNMYSLILSEAVVDEIDKLASKEGTNRSQLVNRILAEYVSVTTPEMMIAGIFGEMEKLFGEYIGLPVSYARKDNTLSVKSALDFRYRPSLRYEVELYRTAENAAGELKVNYRSQSPELLNALNSFFALWIKLERRYGQNATYSADENKWVRSINLPRGSSVGQSAVSRAISEYIKAFDAILKKYLAGGYKTVAETENDYLAALNGGKLLI